LGVFQLILSQDSFHQTLHSYTHLLGQRTKTHMSTTTASQHHCRCQ